MTSRPSFWLVGIVSNSLRVHFYCLIIRNLFYISCCAYHTDPTSLADTLTLEDVMWLCICEAIWGLKRKSSSHSHLPRSNKFKQLNYHKCSQVIKTVKGWQNLQTCKALNLHCITRKYTCFHTLHHAIHTELPEIRINTQILHKITAELTIKTGLQFRPWYWYWQQHFHK